MHHPNITDRITYFLKSTISHYWFVLDSVAPSAAPIHATCPPFACRSCRWFDPAHWLFVWTCFFPGWRTSYAYRLTSSRRFSPHRSFRAPASNLLSCSASLTVTLPPTSFTCFSNHWLASSHLTLMEKRFRRDQTWERLRPPVSESASPAFLIACTFIYNCSEIAPAAYSMDLPLTACSALICKILFALNLPSFGRSDLGGARASISSYRPQTTLTNYSILHRRRRLLTPYSTRA